MRNARVEILVVLTATVALLTLVGCSKDRVPDSLARVHPAAWIDPESPDFHGVVARTGGSEACRTCHGIDLAGGRSGVSCGDCHLESGACLACHGGLDNSTGAPPYGLGGETDDTTVAVGAHTVHIEGTARATAVLCRSCHLVPRTFFDSDHLDLNSGSPVLDSIAEITWQGYADGGQAAWDRTARTCAGTYCHGNFPGGHPANTPVWTGTGQAECGSCHDVGANPADLLGQHLLHTTAFGLDCIECHASVVDSSLQIIAPTLHVNGVVNTRTRDQAVCDRCHTAGTQVCVDCHGGVDNQTGAPPLGLRGETDPQQTAVGAHTAHLAGGDIADGIACRECHLVPVIVADAGHFGIDSLAELVWGPLAGSSSVWNRGAGSCSDTYCHGNFNGGNRSNSPVWTGSAQAACGSCHDVGSNPGRLSGRHEDHIDEGIACRQCHATVVDADLNIIGKQLHVDGARTVRFLVTQGVYQNGTCTGMGCHGPEDW